jgi:hypothetical protein
MRAIDDGRDFYCSVPLQSDTSLVWTPAGAARTCSLACACRAAGSPSVRVLDGATSTTSPYDVDNRDSDGRRPHGASSLTGGD